MLENVILRNVFGNAANASLTTCFLTAVQTLSSLQKLPDFKKAITKFYLNFLKF